MYLAGDNKRPLKLGQQSVPEVIGKSTATASSVKDNANTQSATTPAVQSSDAAIEQELLNGSGKDEIS